jgi:hypothetical protein
MSVAMFDEMNASEATPPVDAHYEGYQRWLSRQPLDVMQARRVEAEMIFRRVESPCRLRRHGRGRQFRQWRHRSAWSRLTISHHPGP